jgi:hypothetical protein
VSTVVSGCEVLANSFSKLQHKLRTESSALNTIFGVSLPDIVINSDTAPGHPAEAALRDKTFVDRKHLDAAAIGVQLYDRYSRRRVRAIDFLQIQFFF